MFSAGTVCVCVYLVECFLQVRCVCVCTWLSVFCRYGVCVYLVECFLQVRCVCVCTWLSVFCRYGVSHSLGKVSVCRMGQKKLPLSTECSFDVLPAVNILLTAVHHTDITYIHTHTHTHTQRLKTLRIHKRFVNV